MAERRATDRNRTLLGGRLVFNDGRSAVDCVVRNISDNGALVQVESPVGIPDEVDLLIGGDDPRGCKKVWQSANKIGLQFVNASTHQVQPQSQSVDGSPSIVRSETLALRAALDEVGFGVVLLDCELRAQFINKAFRKMWRLPDSKADAKPAFVALMYHGRDTRAYKIAPEALDAYVAERVALIKAGNKTPLDLRLANGEVVRLQCAVLPNGGRMLSYNYVTDIVRQNDELTTLRAALDNVPIGIALLDPEMKARFMNRAVRRLWKVPDEVADSRPTYRRLVSDARVSGTYGVPAAQLEHFIERRLALVKAGDAAPQDMQTADGRRIRSVCSVLPNGGRMLTYSDVTDFFEQTTQLERLATTDSMTELCNRRQFMVLAEAEWRRFQRYCRPLSLLMVDIDHFKSVNDQFGHAAGDVAISFVAHVCKEGRRSSDIVGRLGGEEFALLLPESDLAEATIVADRILDAVQTQPPELQKLNIRLTISVGVAEASLSMSGMAALMQAADRALYEAKAGGRNQVRQASIVLSQDHSLAAE